MIHYLDRTFCINPNCTCHPSRRLTQEVREGAERWWRQANPDEEFGGAPISMADLCGAPVPKEYQPPSTMDLLRWIAGP